MKIIIFDMLNIINYEKVVSIISFLIVGIALCERANKPITILV